MLCAALIAEPVYAQGAATLYVQESAPSNPPAGTIWYRPSTGALKVVETTSPLVWGDVTGESAAAVWGTITGTLASQADLQTALDGKQASGNYATGGGTATGTNTGDQTSVSGNAGTATALQNARTINGVSFNGTANITVPAAGSTLTDTVPVSKGGTGLTSLGSALQVLRTNAAGNALEYATPAAGAGGWTLSVQALTSAPVDGQTIYFGQLPKAPVTAQGTSRIYIRKAGAIKAANIFSFSGTVGTNEAWVCHIRLNNTGDTQIASVAAATAERTWSNTGLSIAVVVGDYVEVKCVNPTWATNPNTTIFGGYLYLE